MKNSKKFLALLLALTLVFALVACQKAPADTSAPVESVEPTDNAAPPVDVVSADDIDDNMTSADGKYQVAFITDVGQLKDKSFNQGTFDGVKLYANENGKSYKYYQPANGNEATDDDRYDAMKAAVDGGAEVVVAAGFMQVGALSKAAAEFPDTKFILIDGGAQTDADGNVLQNVAGITFKEEQPGYLAGYAAVKDGFEKLGFSGGGGGTNPAVCRYGYGFVQGANAAAAEMGKQVEINYTYQYGATFQASPELQALVAGWYTNGTQIVFSAGGSIFQSITDAAAANDGSVIGVDVDQSGQSDTVVTSAMKGLASSVQWALGKAYDGTWADIAGVETSLGANEDAVGLPTDTWSMETYTVAEYEALLAGIKDGSVEIDNTVLENGDVAREYSNVVVNYV